MSKPANRRMILKAVASFPLALSLGMLSQTSKKAAAQATEANAGSAATNVDAGVNSAAGSQTEKKFIQVISASDQLPEGIQPIAKFGVNAFPQPWSHVSFEVTREGQPIPGYLVRLPEDQFLAYLSVCPQMGCKFQLFSDAQEIQSEFGIAVSHPVLGCKCHKSAFRLGEPSERLSGPDRPAPIQLTAKRCNDKICILA
jgi:Rieske Fe-S protein